MLYVATSLPINLLHAQLHIIAYYTQKCKYLPVNIALLIKLIRIFVTKLSTIFQLCDVISKWETALREKGSGKFENTKVIRLLYK